MAQIHISNGAAHSEGVDQADAGDVIALSFAEDVDVSRGDMIVESDLKSLTKQLEAHLCWLDTEPLSTSRKYLLRHTTQTVFAKVKAVTQVFDVQTLSQHTGEHTLTMNGIGQVELVLQKPIMADRFVDSLATGSFVLIDEASNHTVAAGMIVEIA